MRGPRLVIPGAVYHLTNRGNRRAEIFGETRDYQEFQTRLGEAVRRYGWLLHAYTLMPNHVHLLVELARATLSEGMQWLTSGYSLWRNARTGQSGHVFQGRFDSRICEKESYLLELVRYLHMNPVRARLVAQPLQWPWSSHRVYMGLSDLPWVTTEPLLERFGFPGDAERLRRFEMFVTDRVPKGMARQLARTVRGSILGSESFIERVKQWNRMPVRRADRDITLRPSLERLAALTSEASSVSMADLLGRSKRSVYTVPRRALVWLAVRRFAYQAASVGRFLQRDATTIGRLLAQAEAAQDGTWKTVAETAEKNANAHL